MTTNVIRTAVLSAIALLLAGCGNTSDPTETTASSIDSGAVASTATTDAASQANAAATTTTMPVIVDASQLTQTEYLVVGKWEVSSIEYPDRTRLGKQLGDTCTFTSDFAMQCTIASEPITGIWQAPDTVEVGGLSIAGKLSWIITEGPQISVGGSSITVSDTEMILAHDGTTWTLVERLPRDEPRGQWSDETTQQLIGSWRLITADEERSIAKIATAGDICTFNPDHTLVCNGDGAPEAIWRTARAWADGSFDGLDLLDVAADKVKIHGAFEIDGDVLTWDTVDSVWERVNEQ